MPAPVDSVPDGGAPPVIVNSARLEAALSMHEEAVQSAVATTAADPVDEAQSLAAFADARAALRRIQTEPGVLSCPDHAGGALLQSFLAEQALKTGRIEPLPIAGYEVKYDDRDLLLGWIPSFITWWRRIVRHDFWPLPLTPELLPDNARIALLGDWGTGLYGAPACAASIERDARPFDVLIHLGDVYYSGLAREIGGQFLRYWPRRKDPACISRALNSNHEMYGGGYGYFDITLNAFQQRSSAFALQNQHWLVVGLDTGYEMEALAHDQAGWLARLILEAGGRKLLLLSHHQPFSLLERQGRKLQQALGGVLDAKAVSAWYWGHEHRLVIYDSHPAWGFAGRCVGHGGYPYFRDRLGNAPTEAAPLGHAFRRLPSTEHAPSGLVLDGENPYVQGLERRYGPHGYMTLELCGSALHEVVHAPDGTVLREGDIQ